ncbi:hypothetical protein BT69DRAFT_1279210 [Atractiella rhizophila]|nr:hypothetical protein BT69DRAFT_1279210 [Atractiella rhizophila]
MSTSFQHFLGQYHSEYDTTPTSNAPTSSRDLSTKKRASPNQDDTRGRRKVRRISEEIASVSAKEEPLPFNE